MFQFAPPRGRRQKPCLIGKQGRITTNGGGTCHRSCLQLQYNIMARESKGEIVATSTAVKERYNKKTYSQWNVKIRKEEFEVIEKIREEAGLSRSELLKMLISEKYNIEF